MMAPQGQPIAVVREDDRDLEPRGIGNCLAICHLDNAVPGLTYRIFAMTYLQRCAALNLLAAGVVRLTGDGAFLYTCPYPG